MTICRRVQSRSSYNCVLFLVFISFKWGGMSSEEQNEAIMLEAALFGGIPEGSEYRRFPFAPHQLMQDGLDRTSALYPQRIPRSPSPGLTAQRLIREQQV